MQVVKSVVNKYSKKSSAFNLKPLLPTGIFSQPAPASTTPLLTPKAFLPPADARAQSPVYKPEPLIAAAGLPIYQAVSPAKYHLSADDVAKIQRLRDEGISRKQIAQDFAISKHLVGIVSTGSKEPQLRHDRDVKVMEKRWKKKTQVAKRVQRARRETWDVYN